jgi:hypothetical protein
MAAGAKFAWQHDPRLHAGGTLSLFDNAASRPAAGRESRAVVLRLDAKRRTAKLVRSFKHPKPLLSTSQGNAQVLPDGHVFVGWGSNEYFTEFDRRGRVLFDARFGGGEADSYRAYRLPWAGRPRDRPAVAARPRGVRTVVFASWNGATAVARWRVLAGKNASQLASVAEGLKRGFETRIVLPSRPRYVAVQALDERGRVLRTSKPAHVVSG